MSRNNEPALLVKKHLWQKSKKTFIKMFLPGVLILTSCGNATTADSSAESTPVDTVVKNTEDTTSNYLICDPGSCEFQDELYLELVNNQVPSAYVSQLSDLQLFDMARLWCSAVNDGKWELINSMMLDEVNNTNAYKLYFWTLAGSSAYCYGDQKAITDYVSTLPEP